MNKCVYFLIPFSHLKHYSCYKTLTLKVYNKRRRATDLISHSSSERRSIFNASQLSKLSNVTCCFRACIVAHSPALELDNTRWFRLQSGPLQRVSGTCGTAPNSPAVSVIVSFKTLQGFKCQHVVLTLTLTMGLLCSSFILEPVSHGSHISMKKENNSKFISQNS